MTAPAVTMLLRPPAAADTIVLLNDDLTFEAYRRAIMHTVGSFHREFQRWPHVLVWGDLSAPLAAVALGYGAQHATICDSRSEVCAAAATYFSTQQAQLRDRCTIVEKSPLQLPADMGVDVLVMHAFGPWAERQGMAVVTHDLFARGVVQSQTATRYVVPSQCVHTVRLYHVPSATVTSRAAVPGVISIGTIDSSPARKVVWDTVGHALPSVVLSREDDAMPISERVEVMRLTTDGILRWPEHVSVVPALDVPVDQCFLVHEWLATLSATEQVGTLLGLDRRASSAARRARALCWSPPVASVARIASAVHTLHLKVAFRPATGDLLLTVVDGVPHASGTRALLEARGIAEATFAKLVY